MALDFIKNIYAKVNFELLYGLAIFVDGNEWLDEVGPSSKWFLKKKCGSNQTLLVIFVITFCGC
jgi:hypothetical protein